MNQNRGRAVRSAPGSFLFLLLCGAALCLLLSGCSAGGPGTRPVSDAETAAGTGPETESGTPTETVGTSAEVLTLNDDPEVPVPVDDLSRGNRLGCVPALYIQTENGRSVKSDTSTVAFSMDVKKEKKSTQTGLTGRIKLRGNASLGWEKKSYTLTFDEKQDPVGSGRGKNRNWVLVSNHCDKSLLRNYIAFWLQEELDGIAWSPWACMVDVYVNGEYRGNYLLAEKITCGDNRLNIDNVTGGIDADYLVELDNYASKSGEKGVTWFTARGIPYEIRGEETHSARRCDAVDARVTAAYDVVCGGDEKKIRELLDIPSAVDAYIAAEVTKNIDCGWSSFFLYFKDGKLYLGPLWDFDLAMGNDYRLDNGSYRRIYAGEDRGFSQGNVWFIQLMKQEWFRLLVAERWQELYCGGTFDRMLEALTETEAVCLSSFKRNFRTWPIFTERVNQEPDSLLTDAMASVGAQCKALYDWLDKRVAWLNDHGF